MAEHDAPILVVYKGALVGTQWSIGMETITIGRATDCDIVLPERQISRYHASIEHDGAGYLLRDLGSKNGTFVNGEAVRGQPYRLRDGDEISLANVMELGFIAGEITLPLEDLTQVSRTHGLDIDRSTRRVCFGRQELDPPLSPAQFTLLAMLADYKGQVITRAEVINAIWPDAVGGVTDQAVDALVYRLRERLAELDPEHTYVVTVRGHGFRYVQP